MHFRSNLRAAALFLMALVTEGTKLVVKHPAPKVAFGEATKVELIFSGGVCNAKNKNSAII